MASREEILQELARRAPQVSAGDIGRYVRENPDEAVVATAPPAIPGPAGVRPMMRPNFGMPAGPRPAPSAGPAGRFSPAQPRFIPGRLASQSSPPPEPPRFTPTQATGLSPLVAIPAAGVAGTGIYQAAQGLRGRRDAEPEDRTYQDVSDLTAVPSMPRQYQDLSDLTQLPQMPRRMQDVSDMSAVPSMPRLSEPQGTAGGSDITSTPTRRAEPESFLSKIFSGKDYQSSGGPMYVQRGGERYLNWGDPESAADFVRASQAMSRMPREEQASLKGVSGRDIEFENRMAASKGKAEGGSVGNKGPSKEQMLHKALEIIHHLIQK